MRLRTIHLPCYTFIQSYRYLEALLKNWSPFDYFVLQKYNNGLADGVKFRCNLTFGPVVTSMVELFKLQIRIDSLKHSAKQCKINSKKGQTLCGHGL